jgi:hypothetical protein
MVVWEEEVSMFSNNRSQMRQVFIDAWRKQKQGLPLEPLQQLIAAIVHEHPEYQAMLENPERSLEQDFHPEGGESNPFLHMAMHITLREQLSTGRPEGILDLYQRLNSRVGDSHAVEHQLMECLGKILWEAQSAQQPPDEQAYLECIRQLVGRWE